MKNRCFPVLWLAALAAAALEIAGGGAQAAASLAATAEPIQDPLPAEASGLMWSGQVQDARGARVQAESLDPRTFATAIERELERARLAADVDRDFDGALARLAELQVRAAWREPYDGRARTLGQVAVARSELLVRLGRVQEAAAALRAVLPAQVSDPALARYVLVPADERIVADARAALAAKAVVEARAVLDRQGRPGARADVVPAEALRDIVGKAIAESKPDVVREIGLHAVPVLEQMIRDGGEAYAEVDTACDPLTLILQLDEPRGAQLIGALLPEAGFFLRKRMLASMWHAKVLSTSDDRTWEKRPDGSPRLVDTYWIPILTTLALDPLQTREALWQVEYLADQDALAPELQAALIRLLETKDAGLLEGLMDVVDAPGLETSRPVLERMLVHDEARVRRFAAQQLAYLRTGSALLGAADDPDPEVRGLVATWIGPHREWIPPWFQRNGNKVRQVNEEVDARGRDVLLKLLSDPDLDVRSKAAHAVIHSPTDFDESVYLGIADDPAIQGQLCQIRKVSMPVLARLLERLARADWPGRLQEIEQRLAQPDGRVPWNQDAIRGAAYEPFLPAVVALFENPAARPDSRGNAPETLFARVYSTENGTPAVLAALLSRRDLEALRAAIDAFKSVPAEVQLRLVRGLPPELLERWLRAVAELPDRNGWRLYDLLVRLDGAPTAVAGPALAVLSDASAGFELRLAGAVLAAPTGGERFREGLVDFLAAPGWPEALDQQQRFRLQSIGKYLAAVDRDALARRLAGAAQVPSDRALNVLDGVARSEWEPARDAGRAVLARWFDDFGPWEGVLESALHGEIGEEDSPWLRRAFAKPELAQAAATVMHESRSPAYLDAFADALTSREMASTSGGKRAREVCVEALVSQLNDDAAERLLRAAAQGDPELRAKCLAGVQTIRTYLDEKARWARSRSGERARDEAIVQLLALLDDPDPEVRAQAALSLATLEAVEHLPRLIALLKDESDAVRRAARGALDALHAKR